MLRPLQSRAQRLGLLKPATILVKGDPNFTDADSAAPGTRCVSQLPFDVKRHAVAYLRRARGLRFS